MAASRAQASGTPYPQLLECIPGSKGHSFPVSMETRLKTGASGPSSGPHRDVKSHKENRVPQAALKQMAMWPL